MSVVIEPERQSRVLLPLAVGDPARTLVFGGRDGVVPLARFLRQVRAVAALLPGDGPAINLCEDRERFLLALCAVALRGATTLLPPSRAADAVAAVQQRHPGAWCIGDGPAPEGAARFWKLPEVLPEADGGPIGIDPDALAVIGYTSGSTGEPAAHPKDWRGFHASTAQNLAALRHLCQPDGTTHVVATVPPQHMYGMELSVLLPLLGDVAVHAGRPFFPRDIVQALHDTPAPRLLVTTPVHLRALVEACEADPALAPPALSGIVSATAPLAPGLAACAESRFRCEVRELFGSTETCVIASRRCAQASAWTPFPGVRLQPQPDGCLVHAPHLHAPVALADLVELGADGGFTLRGRNADLLEIAGKRASLGDLTRKLQAIPGVEDGIVFQLDGPRAGVCRIAALVVAPSLAETQVLAALRRAIDPVFLPRPLRKVAALPRNATGKLPRSELQALLRTLSD
jgi:acyl-coenzyme A synthetase/AMP-(fatty) acid ligase